MKTHDTMRVASNPNARVVVLMEGLVFM